MRLRDEAKFPGYAKAPETRPDGFAYIRDLPFFTPYLWAQSGATGITTTDENGRKIYVNDVTPDVCSKHPASIFSTRRSGLVYWSSTEHRWKPVPSANGATMKAARSAAAEVDQYLGHDASPDLTAVNFTSTGYNRTRAFTAEQIDAAITQSAARHNVDPNLVRSVVKVESNFNPNAVSRKGAMGLMQLMPGTARSLNVTNPFDPEQNVDAGVRHLKRLLESFGGDVKLGLRRPITPGPVLLHEAQESLVLQRPRTTFAA